MQQSRAPSLGEQQFDRHPLQTSHLYSLIFRAVLTFAKIEFFIYVKVAIVAKVEEGPMLDTLPVELVLVILGSCSDIQSLAATALSCITIYQIFLERQAELVPLVLFRDMDDELMPEAIAALESSRSKSTWTRPAILNFIARNFEERTIVDRPWNLADALSVVRLHHQIKGLAIDCATQAKLTRYKDSDGSALTTSKSELNRYERAFYRFELYCNLYHNITNPVISLEDQRVFFFSKFSPWENEQLACVHAYLIRLLTPGQSEYLHDSMSNT